MTVHQIVDLLNEAYAADPVAMSRLVRHSSLCNDALEGHPRIVCYADVKTSASSVSWLGILMGIASFDGKGIEAIWSDNLELKGFAVLDYSIEDELLKAKKVLTVEYSKVFSPWASIAGGHGVKAKLVTKDGEPMWEITTTTQ